MKFIQHAIYWEKTQIKKNLRQKNVIKNTFSLRSSNTHHNIPFNFAFFYELKAKGSSILEKFAWGYHFYSIWVLLKFIFTLKEYQKTVNLLKKETVFLIGIHSMQGWIATTRHGVTRKRLKHKNIKASRKSLQKEPTIIRCLFILNLKPFRS